MADPINTGQKTPTGRIIWNDGSKDYSERTATIQASNGLYYTIPTVDEDGGQKYGSSQEVWSLYIDKYGPIDFLTGEKLPGFKTSTAAIKYAKNRSSTRKQKKFSQGGVAMNNQTEKAFGSQVGIGSVSSARELGAMGSIPPSDATNALDILAEERNRSEKKVIKKETLLFDPEINPDPSLEAEDVNTTNPLETSLVPKPRPENFKINRMSPIDAVVNSGYLLSKERNDGTTKIVTGLDENNPEQRKAINGMFDSALYSEKQLKKGASENYDSRIKAWCATFVHHILTNLGADTLNTGDKFDRLRADKYKNYGTKVESFEDIKEGDIVVLDFDLPGTEGYGIGDHVGFYAGTRVESPADRGYINVVGGNQGGGGQLRDPTNQGYGGAVTIRSNVYKTTNILAIRRITYDDITYEFNEKLAEENPDFQKFVPSKIQTAQLQTQTADYSEGGDVPEEKKESFFERYNPLTGSYRREEPTSVKIARAGLDLTPVGSAMAIGEEVKKDDTSWAKIGVLTAAEIAGFTGIGTPIKYMLRKGTRFKTSKGSTYEATSDNTTVRNKASRPEHPGEGGIQPESSKTIFMPKSELNKFAGIHQNPDIGTEFVPISETRAALKYTNDFGPHKKGDIVGGTEVEFTLKPEIGLSPVEILNHKHSNGIHFGNEITDIELPKETKNYNKGGTAMNKQTEMAFMNQGGLKDDGMKQDPVSGNPVPNGSMANEVRDDIPAQLSEGEYVVPADVVRYYGVKHFEDIRNKAKSGLQSMEANGRIGGEPVPVGGPKAGMQQPSTPYNTVPTQPQQQMSGGLNQGEMNEIQSMMMAVGGFVEEPNNMQQGNTDPYQQQQTMYQQPMAMGANQGTLATNNLSYNPNVQYKPTGGFSFEPNNQGLFSNDPNKGQVQTAVTLYSPDGLIVKIVNLPDQKIEYDNLIAQGYTTTKPSIKTGGGGGGSSEPREVKPWYESTNFTAGAEGGAASAANYFGKSSKIGSVVGGVIGGVLAGPVGAAVGAYGAQVYNISTAKAEVALRKAMGDIKGAKALNDAIEAKLAGTKGLQGAYDKANKFIGADGDLKVIQALKAAGIKGDYGNLRDTELTSYLDSLQKNPTAQSALAELLGTTVTPVTTITPVATPKDSAGLAAAKAMSDQEKSKGTQYAKKGDKRDRVFKGGKVIETTSGPDTRTSAEKIASAQASATAGGRTLATGGKAEGGLMSKKKTKKTKGK